MAIASQACGQTTAFGYSLAIRDHDAAYLRFNKVISQLPPHEFALLRKNFPAFSLEGHAQRNGYCTNPYTLAGTDRVQNRDFGFMYICAAPMMFATESLVIVVLLTLINDIQTSPDRLSVILSKEASYLSDIDWRGQLKPGYVPCALSRRAVAYATESSLDPRTCSKLDYDQVMNFLWPRIKRSELLGLIRSEENRQSLSTYPLFRDRLTQLISEFLFDYVALHESAHFAYGDVWREANLFLERRADILSLKTLASRSESDPFSAFLRALIQPFAMAYTRAVSQRFNPPSESQSAFESDLLNRLKLGMTIAHCEKNWSSNSVKSHVAVLMALHVDSNCSTTIVP